MYSFHHYRVVFKVWAAAACSMLLASSPSRSFPMYYGKVLSQPTRDSSMRHGSS